MKKNRKDELEIVYLAYAKPLYYYLLKLTCSDTIAEELVQETFYRQRYRWIYIKRGK